MAKFPTNPFGPEHGDVLDQEEIDRLLNETTKITGPVFLHNGAKIDDPERVSIEEYDFRNPVFLSEFEMRRLRLMNEDFIRYLEARLSLFLRTDFSLKMSKLTTLPFQKFTESLPSPTHICLFKTEPLLGVGVLEINNRLALTIAERMLGGKGHSVKDDRYLTEIEIALIEDVVLLILEEWCNQWRDEDDIQPIILGHEINGRFLQTSPRDAIILALAMEASIGDCSEQIQIGIPFYTIEPLVKKIQARRKREAEFVKIDKQLSWSETYENIGVEVTGRWDAFEVTLRDLLSLRVGDVVELSPDILQQTLICVSNQPKYRGEVGLEGEKVALKINESID